MFIIDSYELNDINIKTHTHTHTHTHTYIYINRYDIDFLTLITTYKFET